MAGAKWRQLSPLLPLMMIMGPCCSDAVPDLHKAGVSAVAGESAILPCGFTDRLSVNEELNVIWRKGSSVPIVFNQEAFGTQRMQLQSPEKMRSGILNLRINRVQSEDAGLYNCIFTYRAQSFVLNVTLIVKVAPIIVRWNASSSHAVAGESASVVCEAEGDPSPRIVWYSLGGDTKQLIGEGFRLLLNPVSASHSLLDCIADNGIPPAVSKRIRIRVRTKPSVTVENERIQQRLGRTTSIGCSAQGDPLPDLYWTNGRRNFKPNSRCGKYCLYYERNEVTKVVKLQLTIHNLTRADYGPYTCWAESEIGAGAAESSVVELKDPPSRVNQQQHSQIASVTPAAAAVIKEFLNENDGFEDSGKQQILQQLPHNAVELDKSYTRMIGSCVLLLSAAFFAVFASFVGK